jgi:hypothetical protein
MRQPVLNKTQGESWGIFYCWIEIL